jgi:AAA+ superfamily predicted ATPase
MILSPPSESAQIGIPGGGPAAPKPAKLLDHETIVRLWILRLCSHYLDSANVAVEAALEGTHTGHRRVRRSSCPPFEHVVPLIVALAGLGKPPAEMSGVRLYRFVGAKLARRIRSSDGKLSGAHWLDAIDPNAGASIRAVGDLLGLEEVERYVLAFLLMLRGNENLVGAASILGGDLDDRQASMAIASALVLPLRSVQEALSAKGKLMGSQMVRWDHKPQDLSCKFDWVSWGFPQEMLQPGFDPINALRDRIVPAPAPTLKWDQFSHMGELRKVALSYVRQAMAARSKGVNLLLHGDPGVGKSEFSRVLARELGCELFEVSTQDEEGDPIESGRRLRALRLVHGFCRDRRSLLVFDEIEDVFPRPHPVFGGPPMRCKGWVNRVLENNPSVTIWITNAVEALDPAFVRRFDLVLEVKSPPAAVREAEFRRLPVILSDEAVRRMAESDDLSPAVASRAAKVVSAITADLPEGRGPQVMELIVNQTLQAQGHGPIKAMQTSDSVYDPAFINADVDPLTLKEGVCRAKTARLCLYGPPGTGKTAFGHWMARQMGLQIQVRRASDLLSPYVGVAEKNIARAFREAAAERAVLLIDEVDSFLQDRSRAQRSWEVTQVNEFLTQMEQFQGVFIATTNLMDGLDAASLRRFDLKARFGYLSREQVRRLLEAHMEAASVAPPSLPVYGRLDLMDSLTPGDFAAVARQHRFNPLATPAEWVSALERECSTKTSFHRHITGFGTAQAP